MSLFVEETEEAKIRHTLHHLDMIHPHLSRKKREQFVSIICHERPTLMPGVSTPEALFGNATQTMVAGHRMDVSTWSGRTCKQQNCMVDAELRALLQGMGVLGDRPPGVYLLKAIALRDPERFRRQQEVHIELTLAFLDKAQKLLEKIPQSPIEAYQNVSDAAAQVREGHILAMCRRKRFEDGFLTVEEYAPAADLVDTFLQLRPLFSFLRSVGQGLGMEMIAKELKRSPDLDEFVGFVEPSYIENKIRDGELVVQISKALFREPVNQYIQSIVTAYLRLCQSWYRNQAPDIGISQLSGKEKLIELYETIRQNPSANYSRLRRILERRTQMQISGTDLRKNLMKLIEKALVYERDGFYFPSWGFLMINVVSKRTPKSGFKITFLPHKKKLVNAMVVRQTHISLDNFIGYEPPNLSGDAA